MESSSTPPITITKGQHSPSQRSLLTYELTPGFEQYHLDLSQSLLEVLSIDPSMDVHRYRHHLTAARHHLSEIRFRPSPPPASPSSPALLAFDPNITRRLNSYMPLKALQLPDQDETWVRMQRLLDGLEELCEMAEVKRVTTWNV